MFVELNLFFECYSNKHYETKFVNIYVQCFYYYYSQRKICIDAFNNYLPVCDHQNIQSQLGAPRRFLSIYIYINKKIIKHILTEYTTKIIFLYIYFI